MKLTEIIAQFQAYARGCIARRYTTSLAAVVIKHLICNCHVLFICLSVCQQQAPRMFNLELPNLAQEIDPMQYIKSGWIRIAGSDIRQSLCDTVEEF